MIDVLLIGGKGNIGSGLRTYLPKLDEAYQVTSVDLPGAEDKATDPDAHRAFVELDVMTDLDAFRKLLEGRDLVVYLAMKRPLGEMNAMTDYVFNAVMDVCPEGLIIGSSSVHATGGAYVPFDKPPYDAIAERRFEDVDRWPEPLSARMEPWPYGEYGLTKAYVEAWALRFGANGLDAVAARWGGINAKNEMRSETAYYSVWCHQEDAAIFVDRCYKTHKEGKLRSGAHYFVISDNTHNIFDIETPRQEIGYVPVHNAEKFYQS